MSAKVTIRWTESLTDGMVRAGVVIRWMEWLNNVPNHCQSDYMMEFLLEKS